MERLSLIGTDLPRRIVEPPASPQYFGDGLFPIWEPMENSGKRLSYSPSGLNATPCDVPSKPPRHQADRRIVEPIDLETVKEGCALEAVRRLCTGLRIGLSNRHSSEERSDHQSSRDVHTHMFWMESAV